MIDIIELQQNEQKYLNDIVSLHMKCFPKFFLTKLGKGFLKQLYSGYLDDKNSGIIVAKSNNKVVGFMAYSKAYSEFFSKLKRKYLFKFLFYSLIIILKHPSYFTRLFNAKNKHKDVKRQESYIELSSICVLPGINNRGIGTELLNYLKTDVFTHDYDYINLETDAINNSSVNQFYIKNGFSLVRQFKTSEGRLMNEYRYSR